MRVVVLGADGYLGWPTVLRLAAAGHEVIASDSYAKRKWEADCGTAPLWPVPTVEERVATLRTLDPAAQVQVRIGDLCDWDFTAELISAARPDAVVHYGQQCSAPYSMISPATGIGTQVNNLLANLHLLYAIREHAPDAHLVKLGTMGEYGTPNIDIEEGFLTVTHHGRTDTLPFPKQPGSVYHLSKVHDSHNIDFACRIWGLRATDLNQGVVYGLGSEQTDRDPALATAFRYDEVFGTALNRFLVQAVAGHPLTVYGSGGQTRGYLNLLDTLACVQLTVENPPEAGTYRVFNQFTEQFSINELANRVAAAAATVDLPVRIDHLPNPRIEKETHYYNAAHTKLLDLGLHPHLLDTDFLTDSLTRLLPHRDHITSELFYRGISWRPQH